MIFRYILSLLIFIVFCALIEYYFGWSQLLAPWAEQSWPTLLTAMALTFLTYWLRAMRQYDYFRREMSGGFWLNFKLMLQHNLLNNLLPMRTGELSFPLLMARYFDVAADRSIPALLWFRVMDLHTLLSLALLAGGSYWLGLPQTLALAMILLPLPWLMFLLQGWLAARLPTHSPRRVLRLIAKVLDSLPQSPRDFWHAWAWTVINWVVKLGVFAWVLLLFSDIPHSAAWLGAIAGDLTSVLPVHGIAGVGTYEAGVVAGLLPYGISAKEALPAAINLHLFLLATTLMGGLLSTLLPGKTHG